MSLKVPDEHQQQQQPQGILNLKLDNLNEIFKKQTFSSPKDQSSKKYVIKLSRSTQQIMNNKVQPMQLEFNFESARPTMFLDSKQISVKKLKYQKDHLQQRVNEQEQEIQNLKRELQMREQDVIDQDYQLQYSKELIQQLRGEIHDLKQFMKSDKRQNIVSQAKMNEAILLSLMSRSDLEYLRKLITQKKDDQGIYLKIDPRPLRIGEDGLLSWVKNMPMVAKSLSPSQQVQQMVIQQANPTTYQSPSLSHRTQAQFDRSQRIKTDPSKAFNVPSPRQHYIKGQKYEF